MASNTLARIGHGTTFERDNGATFDAIAEITSLTPPQYARETVDTTNFSSVERYRDFISGLRDAGEASLEINWIPTDSTYQLLLSDFDNDDCVGYKIVLPDTSEVAFDAFVTGITPQVPLEDKMTASITLKVIGKPVWTYAAP